MRAFIIATITVLTAGLAGQILLGNFGFSLNALILAGAIILFLVALQALLQQISPESATTRLSAWTSGTEKP